MLLKVCLSGPKRLILCVKSFEGRNGAMRVWGALVHVRVKIIFVELQGDVGLCVEVRFLI